MKIKNIFATRKPIDSVEVHQPQHLTATVDWSASGNQHEEAKCPVCGKNSTTIAFHIVSFSETLVVLKCECDSIFFPGAIPPDYESIEGEGSFYLRMDQADGIDAIIKPLLFTPDLEEYSVVDLGCGSGYAVDYLNFVGRSAVGYDPSPSSQLSARTFRIDIRGLPDAAEIENFSHPNIIFASEVIEHVPDPRAFLRETKEMTRDNGYVFISTPNADYVERGNSEVIIISMMGVYQHLFLLSEKALAEIAHEVRFPWVKTWTENDRLFLCAGPAPIRIENTFTQDLFAKYLESRTNADWIEESLRWRCFGYRLFKHRIHSGQYEEAIPLWNGLVKVYSDLGLPLEKPEEVVSIFRREVEKTEGFLDPVLFPFNTAMLLFLQGTFQLAHRHDKLTARPYFDGALAIAKIYADIYSRKIFQNYDQEISLLPEWIAKILGEHWK